MAVAIVAVPNEDDYVWRISSEKVPHLTLLYLGESEETMDDPEVVKYIDHVTKMVLKRFGLSVDRRGTLGDDEADVIFFDKGHNHEKLELYRALLLKNTKIREAYESAEQFPSWTPHLTLGYPESPARKDDRDYPGISWVNFDAIELWTDEYAGPEFVLQSEDYVDFTMSQMKDKDDILKHYGVKGMKWGVRKERRAEKKLAKKDAKFERKVYSPQMAAKLYNAASKSANADLPGINKKYEGLNLNLPGPKRDAYRKEVFDNFNKHMQNQADALGLNPSGTKRISASVDFQNATINVHLADAKHDELSNLVITFDTDENGFVTKFKVEEDVVAHYGIKGMKWGVRRPRGKDGRVVSGDAKKAEATIEKIKSKGIRSTTNKELKELNNRLNMERQYAQLSPKSRFQRGKLFAAEALGVGKTYNEALAFANSPGGRQIREVIRR